MISISVALLLHAATTFGGAIDGSPAIPVAAADGPPVASEAPLSSAIRPPAGYPNETDTGVRPGVVLKRHDGDLTVTTDGAVISNLEIHGTLRIEARDVVVRDTRVVNDSWYDIIIPSPNTATVEFCDITGAVNGIAGAGTFRSNKISRTNNGINVYGESLIEGNYIYDMHGGDDAHFDGIENNGASGMVVRRNSIVNDSAQTSAIMMSNYFGPIKGAVIEDNFLSGGSYTIYADGRSSASNPISDVRIARNKIGRGLYGYYAFFGNQPVVTDNQELGRLGSSAAR